MASEPPPAVSQVETVAEAPVFNAEPDAAGTDADFYKLIGIDPNTLDPFANVEGELDASDLAINRAYKIDQANQQQAADDLANVLVTAPYDSSAESGFETWTPPEDFSTDQEPGFEAWNPPVEVLPKEDIPEMVITAPKEPKESPATPASKIPITPTPKIPTTTSVPTDAPIAKNPLTAALAAAIAQGYMPGVGDLAHIKWENGLYGILPWNEQPATSAEDTKRGKDSSENSDDVLAALEDSQYATGGHVDDFSIEALLHILRS